MGFVKNNAVPIAVGVALGYFAVPYLMNLVKNR